LWFWHLNLGLALPHQAHQRPSIHFQITLQRFRINACIMECSRVFPSIPYSVSVIHHFFSATVSTLYLCLSMITAVNNDFAVWRHGSSVRSCD
jgi:hypothetical protein